MKKNLKTLSVCILLLVVFTIPTPCREAKKVEKEANRKSQPNTRSWVRPGLEFLAFMGYSQTRYWIKYSKFIEDWQYKLNWHDQSKRWFTLDAWRFDSNAFSLNWTHSLAGCIYYNFARTSGLDQKNSFLFTLAASAWWEYVAEWREVVSINDMIFTPVGGYITGEFWYRMTRSLQNRFKPAALVLNPALAFNPSRRLGEKDKGGEWRLGGEISLAVGGEHRSGKEGVGPIQSASFSARIRSGAHRDPFGTLDVQIRLAEESISETSFFCMVPHSLMPYAGEPPPLTFNWASAFGFYQRKAVADYDSDAYQIHVSPEEMLDIPRNYQDKMAVIHMLGPQLHHHLDRGKLKLDSSLSLLADFSLCNSLALNEYSGDNDLHPLTSTAFAYGYYYGLGLSLLLENSLQLGSFALTTSLGFTQAWSVNTLDRFRETPALKNPTCHDGALRYRAVASWTPFPWPLALQVNLEGRCRWGSLDETKVSEAMSLVTVGMAVKF